MRPNRYPVVVMAMFLYVKKLWPWRRSLRTTALNCDGIGSLGALAHGLSTHPNLSMPWSSSSNTRDHEQCRLDIYKGAL